MSTRYDMVSVPNWVATKFVLTPDGKLVGRAPCTNIGVFTYRKADGSVIRELRLPEEVFNPLSMETLKNKPVTLGHTDTLIPENSEDIVGKTGTDPINGDNLYLSIDMEISDNKAIEAIKQGTNFLSCAYTCDIEWSSGRWLGMDYDAIQRNIKYGHVAIVQNPRAGETARIHLDSDDAIMDSDVQKEEGVMPENVVKIDASEVKDAVKEIMEEHNKQIADMQLKLDSLLSEKSKIEAERDTYKDKVESLEKKIEEITNSKMDEELIEKKVLRRVKIIEAAKSAGIEISDGMSELDMQKAVILKVFPKANLDDKDSVYIDARFDSALESLEMHNDAQMRMVNAPVNTDAVSEDIVKKAKEKYLARLLKKE